MAEALIAVTTEYVKCFLALMGKGFIWSEHVRRQLAEDGLDALDVTHVIVHGDIVSSDKETADGVKMVMLGHTCDEVCIRVKFWMDTDRFNVRILSVTKV